MSDVVDEAKGWLPGVVDPRTARIMRELVAEIERLRAINDIDNKHR